MVLMVCLNGMLVFQSFLFPSSSSSSSFFSFISLIRFNLRISILCLTFNKRGQARFYFSIYSNVSFFLHTFVCTFPEKEHLYADDIDTFSITSNCGEPLINKKKKICYLDTITVYTCTSSLFLSLLLSSSLLIINFSNFNATPIKQW